MTTTSWNRVCKSRMRRLSSAKACSRRGQGGGTLSSLSSEVKSTRTGSQFLCITTTCLNRRQQLRISSPTRTAQRLHCGSSLTLFATALCSLTFITMGGEFQYVDPIRGALYASPPRYNVWLFQIPDSKCRKLGESGAQLRRGVGEI